ncbi:MAG: hypothetical protein IJV77_06640 [Clostridia bacterium]|nr:hypothetical protein [Clostridia bacterium]
MDNKIIDGMKKESKKPRNAMILCYLFAVLMPLMHYLIDNDKFSDTDILLIFLWCFIFGSIGLYGWLYAIKYRVEFDNEKVYLKTLFRTIELNICDVKKYTCNRYRKSVFYQFNLFINDKKILINTRYKDEFEKVLKDYKIEQIIK